MHVWLPLLELHCCGRERGTTCPNGDPCETLDGAQSVCSTSAECGPCETRADCGTDECLATAPDAPKVCLAESKVAIISAACRADLSQVWRKDVCGTWLERGGRTAVASECRDDSNQVWSQDQCGSWIELAEDCGASKHCEAAQCLANAPEIEVSPTLLDFGDVELTTEKALTVSIGNVGYAPLEVHDIAVDAAFADLFSVSSPTIEVGVDDIVPVTITFAPKGVGEVKAKLFIRSKDADEPKVTVLMNASGVPKP